MLITSFFFFPSTQNVGPGRKSSLLTLFMSRWIFFLVIYLQTQVCGVYDEYYSFYTIMNYYSVFYFLSLLHFSTLVSSQSPISCVRSNNRISESIKLRTRSPKMVIIPREFHLSNIRPELVIALCFNCACSLNYNSTRLTQNQ